MDTKSKHTPGPWSIGEEATCLMATDEKGGRFHAIDSANHGALAVVVTKLAQDYPEGSSCERLMANARLIAAAPELLAALRAICDSKSETEEYAAIVAAEALMTRIGSAS